LTLEREWELQIGGILWPKEKEATLGMLSNMVYALPLTWEELGIIRDEVEPPDCILLKTGHLFWTDHVLHILNKVIAVEQ